MFVCREEVRMEEELDAVLQQFSMDASQSQHAFPVSFNAHQRFIVHEVTEIGSKFYTTNYTRLLL